MKLRGTDTEIKPCPFCGCTDIDYFETDYGQADDPYFYVISCTDCNANVFADGGELDDAIKLWNRRA
jgi:Lar family restriction alleviation protein